jgi:hypothetical protein
MMSIDQRIRALEDELDRIQREQTVGVDVLSDIERAIATCRLLMEDVTAERIEPETAEQCLRRFLEQAARNRSWSS